MEVVGACAHVCIHVVQCVCVYVCIHTYVHIHTKTPPSSSIQRVSCNGSTIHGMYACMVVVWCEAVYRKPFSFMFIHCHQVTFSSLASIFLPKQ